MASHYRRLNTYADIVNGLPLRTSPLEARTTYLSSIKPALDVALTMLLLVPATIVICLCAIAIALDGHSPFYRQRRIGKDGHSFDMLKLRSMTPDADKVLKSYLAANPQAQREWDLTQKLKKDPRITGIGRFIRKTSLDELPQLFNVLRGEMSLVGPRPMMLDQRALYPGVAYYAMRPGITGFWQTAERNATSFSDRAIYDTNYFRNVSFATDLRILFKTVGVVLKGTGY